MENNHPWVRLLRGVVVTGIICAMFYFIADNGFDRLAEANLRWIESNENICKMHLKSVADGRADARKAIELSLSDASLEFWKWQYKEEKKFELLPVPDFEPEEKVKPVPAPNPFLELDEGWHPTPEWKKKKDTDDGKDPESVPIPTRQSFFT